MTIKDLIKRLQDVKDDDAVVVVFNSDGLLHDLTKITYLPDGFDYCGSVTLSHDHKE